MSNQRSQLITLLRERSVRHGTFTLSSGRTSSLYIDARCTTMSALGLELIGSLGIDAIRRAGWVADLVGGLTMGADPVAYAIARASRESPPVLDAFAVRKAQKEHGAGRRIEGCFRPGARVVVVEDVITTGGSALQALQAVTTEGATAVGVLAVVDRREGGRDAIESAGYSVVSLVAASDLQT